MKRILPRFTFILAFILVSCAFTGGAECFAEGTVPSPSVAESDATFLALPGVDLENQTSSPNGSRVPRVGDQIRLKVVPHEITPGLKIDSQSIPNLDEQGWSIEVKTASPNSASNSMGEVLSATLLKPGKITLPSLPIRDSQGKAVARTHPFTLEVASAIGANDPQPEQPEGLEPPVGLQFPIWVVGSLLVLAVLAIGAIVYGVYRWYRSRKLRSGVEIPGVVQAEDELAIARLNELEKQGLLGRGEYKAYYFRVSEILKNYLGSRYQFDAVESTSAELISLLEVKLPVSLIDRLKTLFSQLDRVKFTDWIPEPREPVELLKEARAWILTTRRLPTVLDQTGVQENASR